MLRRWDPSSAFSKGQVLASNSGAVKVDVEQNLDDGSAITGAAKPDKGVDQELAPAKSQSSPQQKRNFDAYTNRSETGEIQSVESLHVSRAC